MVYKVGYFVGSLSAASINRRLAKALVALAPKSLQLTEIDYSHLPLYNHDYDAAYPAEAVEYKNAIAAQDAVLFVTPEYNRSIPGALKNAIDWGSRPWGHNVFDGKPGATIGTSGGLGTAMAQQHLKNVMAFLNMPTMGQPEGYIRFTDNLITESGEVTADDTAEFLRDWMRAFAAHVEKNVEAHTA